MLQQQPNNASALNALGYLLVNKNTQLDEAKILIERSLEIAPDNPAALDSLGWLHFKLGNNQLALHYLKQAYSKQPDPEIAAHLGELLWYLKLFGKAASVWQQGLDIAPNHPVLIETINRLNAPKTQ